MQWVIKISKLCNLRCTYCYEYENLADATAIDCSNLINLFKAISNSDPNIRHEFIWHGGEPLLVHFDFYKRIAANQDRYLKAAGIRYQNFLQTNLYKLNANALRIIKFEGFSPILGISFDPFGEQRIDVNKKLSNAIVLKNIAQLDSCNIKYNFITVLTKDTLCKVEEIYSFFKTLGRSVRFLPIYKNANELQIEQHGVSPDAIAEALAKILILWIKDGVSIKIEPLESILILFIRFKSGVKYEKYPNRTKQRGILIDTDGCMYRFSDEYDVGKKVDSLENFKFPIKAAQTDADCINRINKFCSDCEFYGPCDGSYIAESTSVQLDNKFISEASHPCVTKKILSLMLEMSI